MTAQTFAENHLVAHFEEVQRYRLLKETKTQKYTQLIGCA